MAIENSDRDCSVRLEPERHGDLGEPVRRLPEALAMRCREWSRALWAPVYLRLGLGVFTLGAIAMMGARAQGEPRGTVVATLAAPGAEPRPEPPVAPAAPAPCVTVSAGSGLSETSASPQGRAGSGIAEAPPAPRSSDGRIILNTATEADFDRLPGVGPKRAQEIVKLRERLGRFRRVSDLLRIRGVGPKTLKKWQDLIVLDPPPVEEPKAPEEKSGATGDAPRPAGAGGPKPAEPAGAKGSG